MCLGIRPRQVPLEFTSHNKMCIVDSRDLGAVKHTQAGEIERKGWIQFLMEAEGIAFN